LLRKIKAEKYKKLVEDLLNVYQIVGRNVIEESFFTLPLVFLLSEPEYSERLTWGTIPPGYFHHAERYAGTSSQNMLADCRRNLIEGCLLLVTHE
jgi:hypothetical protein